MTVDKLKYMKKNCIALGLVLSCCLLSLKGLAWGKTGHALTGSIAWYYMDDSTRKIVKEYLDMSFEDAANWMDDVRSNSYFEFQRTWHYVDFEKGTTYKPTHEKDLLVVLHSAIAQLKQYKTLPKKDTKRALLLIFHLVGDLHQPLHCGYASDRGGNDITVRSENVSGNLHSIWDTDILEYKKINLDSCIGVYNTLDSATLVDIKKINELKWIYESRSHLDDVYNFKDGVLDDNYLNRHTALIKKQLLIAGLRIAAVLNSVFKQSANT